MQATNEVITRVPCSTQEEMNMATKAAEDVFPSWSSSSVMSRQCVMFNLQYLIRENMVRMSLCVCTCVRNSTVYVRYQDKTCSRKIQNEML